MSFDKKYDVIVVGGGISGSMAAISAAREGVSVLLVEQHGFLGGMLTAAGVGPMMTFHAGQTQVVQGITGELIDRLKAKGKSTGHIYDTTKYTYTVTPFDAEAMKHELDLMCTEAGVEVLFHTMLAAVDASNGKINDITVCSKAGLKKLRAQIYIDATGDGDLSVWAGAAFTKGRGDGKCQPVTLKARFCGVDTAATRRYIKDHPEDFPTLDGDVDSIDKGERLSLGGFLSLVTKAKANGDFNIERDSLLIFETSNPGEFIINTSRIFGCDPTDTFSLSKAEMTGREQVACLERFLKGYVPGFENASLMFSGPNIGIRSSRQISGKDMLKAADILEFKKPADSIAYCGYPIDIHPVEAGIKDHYVVPKFDKGDYYGIPMGCMLNDAVSNLITTGRCVSAEFEAQAAIRTTPTMGAVGHASGALAAVACKNEKNPCDVDAQKVRSLLKKQNGFVV
jgi:hypothetical protein